MVCHRALSQTGTLVIYGFHTNLPNGALLNPLAWLRMVSGVLRMPKFDPMDLVISSKNVCGFNLSFFAEEVEMVDACAELSLESLCYLASGQLCLCGSAFAALRLLLPASPASAATPLLPAASSATVSLTQVDGPYSLDGADMKQIIRWVEAGQVSLPQVTEFAMHDLPMAHDLIQSGQSVGKIVCTTGEAGVE